jgi:biopolymer transport protein ExbB
LALSLTEAETGFLARIKQGGFWIFPILLLAAIALIAAIAKWIQLAKVRVLASSRVRKIIELVRSGEKANALNECATISHPAGRILHRGVTLAGRDRGDLEEGMFETFLEEQPALQRGLPFIAIASATAPLLGLLGTVTGMIETFRLINLFGTSDARNLASGISEALVTTEFGLIVAIPALILHALLSRKVQGIKATMEMASLAFLNGIGEKDDTSELKSI